MTNKRIFGISCRLFALKSFNSRLVVRSARLFNSEISRNEERKEEKMDELKLNPYFAKYANKVKNLQESSPTEFESKLKILQEEKIKAKSIGTNAESCVTPSQNDESLDSILKLELIKEKSSEEIEQLWKDYYIEKDSIFAVIPVDEYSDIKRKISEFPNFIYPLPRAEGYQFFVQRWIDETCHFTQLSSFQKLGENAPTCLSMKHYIELAAEKGIVLMKGQPDLKVLSVYESQLLALQVKMFYGLHSGLKFNFVRIFNNSPETFRHMDLIIEFENYKKDIQQKKEWGTEV